MKKRRLPPLSLSRTVGLMLSLVLAAPSLWAAQEKAQPAVPERAKVLAAAREIMQAQTYCALITIDETGRPQVRTMNPFPPEEDMTVWFATNTRSRKVREMQRDARVSLYYADHARATGYVALRGRAELVDDMREVLKRKRAYWDSAFPGLKNIVLIKVVPERIEVLNYKAGFVNDPVTWQTPALALPALAP
ncbi:MAG: pyridoxamine 5'-phosphate oxidase family protein [Betaproteobacteria bacterium]